MATKEVTDKDDWFTFRVNKKGKGAYVEVYDGNMGSVVVESKLSKDQARELGEILLEAAGA